MKRKVGYFRHPRYTFKLVREFSSFIIALYALFLLYRLYTNSLYPSTFQIIVASIALFFALYHTLTWLYLLPKISKIKIGGRVLGDVTVFLISIMVWILISLLIILLLI